MTVLQDENKRLSFIFAEENEVRAYDQMFFYRSEIEREISGIKAIDFLCVDESRHLSYFIEVKDYGILQNDASMEHKKRQKAEDLALEVARKVLETIAGLWVASNWSDCPFEEKCFSAKVLQNTVRVVLHYELPSDWTEADRKLRMADLKNKLAKKLRIIDTQPLVIDTRLLHNDLDSERLLGCPWTVRIAPSEEQVE